MKSTHDYVAQATKDMPIRTSSWSRGGVSMKYVWRVEGRDGVMAICGAYQLNDLNYYAGDRQILQKSRISYDDKIILKNMLFFNRIKRKEDISKATLHCKKTQEPLPRGSYTVQMSSRQVTIRQ